MIGLLVVGIWFAIVLGCNLGRAQAMTAGVILNRHEMPGWKLEEMLNEMNHRSKPLPMVRAVLLDEHGDFVRNGARAIQAIKAVSDESGLVSSDGLLNEIRLREWSNGNYDY